MRLQLGGSTLIAGFIAGLLSDVTYIRLVREVVVVSRVRVISPVTGGYYVPRTSKHGWVSPDVPLTRRAHLPKLRPRTWGRPD